MRPAGREPAPTNLLSLAVGCPACPRGPWCAKTLGGTCLVPTDPGESARFWEEQGRIVGRVGGVGPRALPPVAAQPDLPALVHVHVKQGPEPATPWPWPIGVYAKDAILLGAAGRPVNARYLRDRGLDGVPKVLVISGTDPWLAAFCRGVGPQFFDGLASWNFAAVICPNLSAYHHAEHRVGLDNRAIVRRFLECCLERGVPAAFHTYLEDAPEHARWLVRHLELNPTQRVVATGFDRGGANDPAFVARRLEILAGVEQAIGRPLRVVLANVLGRLSAIRAAHRLFPGRVHLVGQSVFLRSVKGSELVRSGGWVAWRPDAREFARGVGLFLKNAEVLRGAIAEQVPGFFDRPDGAAGEIGTDEDWELDRGAVWVRRPRESAGPARTVYNGH